jgi:hypothetical protein
MGEYGLGGRKVADRMATSIKAKEMLLYSPEGHSLLTIPRQENHSPAHPFIISALSSDRIAAEIGITAYRRISEYAAANARSITGGISLPSFFELPAESEKIRRGSFLH